MSIKKINNFLNEARINNIVDEKNYNSLKKFATEYDNRKSIFSLINIIGSLGALAIILGIILIISHNWTLIPNSIKISFYILSLIAFHLVAYLVRENYPKTSSALHFAGALYIIAGIGLIAQIFHLSDNSGSAYLLWFLMIVPLAITLENKQIIFLSVFVFYLWLTINSEFNHYLQNESSITLYYTTLATSLMILPKISEKLFSSNFEYIGGIILGILLVSMGFSHEILSTTSKHDFNCHPVTLAIFAINIILTIYIIASKNSNYIKYIEFAIFLLISSLVSTSINFFPIIATSLIYWVLAFAYGVLIIYYGIKNQNKNLVNIGSWYITLEIITRFIDLVGTMLFTGAMFILFGLIMITFAFYAEKYRKYLINKFLSYEQN